MNTQTVTFPTRADVHPQNRTHRTRELQSGPPHPLNKLETLASTTTYHRGQKICGQGSPANTWFCVKSGAARRYVVRCSGRRQIIDLLLPGDYFGFAADNEYDFAVEAVPEGTIIASYPRRRIEAEADKDPQLAREIRQVSFAALSRLQSQLLIMGHITAIEKVSSFLLEMAARLSGEDEVVLPVSRYDIADYLAVSVETVSRSLTDLKQRGLIRLSGTRIVRIVDREALEETESGIIRDWAA